MGHTFVVAEQDVEPTRREGDTALEKLVLGAHTGSRHLEQRVVRYDEGRSLPRGAEERDEILYVVSGSGTLELDGEPHPLEPDSGVYVRAGESYAVENPGPGELVLVSTSVPVEHVNRPPRQVVVRFADRPELRADAKRTFRYLVNGEGFAHINGDSIPLKPGSCFHLPPQQVHCIENTGPGTMRILGVFHPSGDPASRAYEDTSELAPA